MGQHVFRDEPHHKRLAQLLKPFADHSQCLFHLPGVAFSLQGKKRKNKRLLFEAFEIRAAGNAEKIIDHLKGKTVCLSPQIK